MMDEQAKVQTPTSAKRDRISRYRLMMIKIINIINIFEKAVIFKFKKEYVILIK